ncbi:MULTISPECIES: NAD-dependent epimerase/dehydratase family protein [Pseudomonas]|uniref:NAD-dependent epimerase/dehydratase family protein n=1 Tax=Pseudomonas TaxID=286 RepID=UPI000BA31D8E|nr:MULTISPECIES: NAD-dependent epimerase/dehydratase family protein [Pseudomonas]MDR9862874.1 NAD-dependent epimerase/dehydratase family protein [Pseudomonas baetica]
MKIFVTGASGFIGKNLCEKLSADGHDVVALHRRLPELASGEVVLGDLDDIDAWSDRLAGVDCVIHLAGRAHVLNSHEQNPLEVFRKVNRDACLRLAEACVSKCVQRFVFISSIGVNGNETHGQAFTEQSLVSPHAPYAIAKYEAEVGLTSLLENAPTELVMIRPPLVYGAHAPGNFRRLLKLVGSGLPMPFGLVTNRRSIISVKSLCNFIALAAHHPKAAGQLFLVADEPVLSTADMVRSLAQGMGKRGVQLPVPTVVLKIMSSLVGKKALYQQLCGSLEVDSSHAQRTLEWEPERDTRSELRRESASFRSL